MVGNVNITVWGLLHNKKTKVHFSSSQVADDCIVALFVRQLFVQLPKYNTLDR